jgi:hypothetical protein
LSIDDDVIATMPDTQELDQPRSAVSDEPSWQRRLEAGHWQLAIAFAVAFVVVAVFLRPWSYGRDYVFPYGTDALWQQAIFQMHGQAGIFGTTHHLSWPVGANPWRLPQLGVLMGAWAWVTVGWFGLGTASSVLWYLAIAAGLDAAAIVFWIRGFVGSRLWALTLAIGISIGVSVFTVSHQLNLASFFPVPLALRLLVAMPRMPRRRKLWGLGGLAALAFVSPLWWIAVLVLMVPLFALAPLVRRNWRRARDAALVWMMLLAGMAAQAAVFVVAKSNGPGADSSRLPWTSDLVFGHMTDLLIGSPLIRKVVPGVVKRLTPGSSVALGIGIPLLVTTAVALVVLVALPPRRLRSGVDTSILASATLISALFWLGGGFGNLQAAIAVLAGTVTPAREWSRMIVVLAVVGSAWLALIFDEFRARALRSRANSIRVWSGAVAVFFLVCAIGDLAAVDVRYGGLYSRAPVKYQAAGAVGFLSARLRPCPVAQLPDEQIPNGRVKLFVSRQRLTYHAMAPYVIAPKFYWSAGSYDPKHPTGLGQLGTTVVDADVARLRNWGYCAVLYDKAVGAVARARGADINGRKIAFSGAPAYQDSAYSVYLLPPK